MPRLSLTSPVGRLTLFEEGGAITALVWGGKSAGQPTRILNDAKRQLAAYFAGKRKSFDLDLAPEGSAAELRVWAAMRAIPYGETRSYGELARALKLSPRAQARPTARGESLSARGRPRLRAQSAPDPAALPPRDGRKRRIGRL